MPAYWIFAAPAILLAILSLIGERKRARFVAESLERQPSHFPRVSVIVPVKGDDEGLRENLEALASLDYPGYDLILTAHSADDIPKGVLPRRAMVVLAHGRESEASEKVQNLAAAVKAAHNNTEIFAFADSDGCVTKRWLRSLVAALEDTEVGAATGYRWFAPEPPTFWSLMRGVWDAVAIGRLGAGDAPFLWGGSMAIRRQTFFEIGVFGAWKDAISDDYALAEAVHRAGLRIAYVPGALVPSRDRLPMAGFFGWARRQLVLTRVYQPRLWWAALAAHVIYCGGMAASVAASIAGNRLAEWALIAQLSPGMLKGLNRATLAKAALPEYEPWFKRHSWVHAIWTPLATWIWLLTLAVSALGNSITWRGRRYRLKKNGPPTKNEEPR